jgi:hypothetical protein
MNSDFTRKIAASQNLQQGGQNLIESAKAVEPTLNDSDNLDCPIIINISGDYVVGDKPMGDKVHNQTVQNNSGEAQGSQVIVQEGGIAYVGETHISNATPDNSSPDDLSTQFRQNILPKNIIRLSIHRSDNFQYNFRVYYRYNDGIKHLDCVLSIEEITPLLEKIAVIFAADLTPINLYGRLERHNNYIQKCRTIAQLLQCLSRWDKFGLEDSILEIYDYEELDISWESMKINRIPLGITMQIVRQDTENNIENTNNSNYSDEHHCEGDILAHTTSTTCWWQAQYQHTCFPIFGDFISNLHRPTREYGLVLIDGFCSEGLITVDPTSLIVSSNLLNVQASVVLVSGELDFCQSLDLGHQELLRLFQCNGARGVIGTLKLIEVTIAEEVIKNFFNLLEQQREGSRLTVPAMLRTMRRDVYDRFLNHDDPDNDDICALYLATFQYIYYGNPLTTLQLTRVNI